MVIAVLSDRNEIALTLSSIDSDWHAISSTRHDSEFLNIVSVVSSISCCSLFHLYGSLFHPLNTPLT
jgi:hypothetical protein